MSVALDLVIDEHELYPVHEEDSLPQKPEHEYQVRTLKTTLQRRFPRRWVTGETCMYWQEGAFGLYRAPDVLVVDCPWDDFDWDVWLAWRDHPALLVIEVGSKSTLKDDEGPKVELYLDQLGVLEYAYYRPHRMKRWRRLQLWRIEEGEGVLIEPDARGRIYCRSLDVEFGLDEIGLLRVFEADGRLIPTPEEEADEERRRADEERHRADAERRRGDVLQQEVERLRAALAARNGAN